MNGRKGLLFSFSILSAVSLSLPGNRTSFLWDIPAISLHTSAKSILWPVTVWIGCETPWSTVESIKSVSRSGSAPLFTKSLKVFRAPSIRNSLTLNLEKKVGSGIRLLDFTTFPSYYFPMKIWKRKGVMNVKTSIEIPERLWTEAKIRAAREKKSLQEVVADALGEHLKRPKKGGKKDEG
jgi:hypothetical protein